MRTLVPKFINAKATHIGKVLLLTGSIMGSAVTLARAQVSYTTAYSAASPYTQSFNPGTGCSLPTSGSGIAWSDNSTVTGWYTFCTIPNGPATQCKPNDGTSAASGVVNSYGASGNSNRAFGIIPGSTPGNVMFGVRFVNNTTTTLTSITVGYSGEQWRSDSTTPCTMSFAYKVGTSSNLNDNTIPWVSDPALNFVSPVATNVGKLDGTQAANRQAGISDIITGISWAPGQELWLRFYCLETSAGNQDLSIDSFSFSASGDSLAALQREAFGTVATVDQELLNGPAGALKVRDLPMAAYICLALNYHLSNYTSAVAEAETYLNAMFTKQDTTSGSPTFGQFYWEYTDTQVNVSGNSNEFCLKALAVILKRYGDSAHLGSAYVSSITPQTLDALTAMRNTTVSVSYTNMYLMRAQGMLLLGEALNDSTSQTAGISALDAWFSDLAAEFVHEYDSPTYTIVSLGALMTIANNTSNTVEADKCRSALDLMAADTAANYFNPQERMGGSHSRDYDFPFGEGDISQFYYIDGLTPFSDPPAYYAKADLYYYLNTVENGYRTPPDILAYGDAVAWPTRIVKTTWGPTTAPGQDRYNYITPDFGIGSSGSAYDLDSQIDKSITAELTAGTVLPQVSVVYDPYDNPYGTTTAVNASGQTIDSHLKSAAAIVQDHGTVLSLANLSPEWNTLGPYNNISASILFPEGATAIYLDGTAITNRTGTYTAGLNSVIAVQEGNAVIAARFFLVDGMNDGVHPTYVPDFYVKFDDATQQTARMVAYLYKAPAGYTTDFGSSNKPRIGTVFAAQTCVGQTAVNTFLSAVKNAAITPTVSGTKWSASVSLNGTTLAAQQDLSNNSVTSRTVNAANYVPADFTISDDNSTTVDLYSQRFTKMIGSGWVLADVGSLPTPSSASYNSSAVTTSVTSTGGDFWGNTDAGSFTYRPVTGDCTITARVDSESAASTWSKAGVMIRASLDPGSVNASTYMTPGQGARFSYRPTANNATSRAGLSGSSPAPPYWVRITRVASTNTFSSFVSPDGVTWSPMETSPQTVTMPATVYVGFEACSCVSTTPTTAVFSNVSVH